MNALNSADRSTLRSAPAGDRSPHNHGADSCAGKDRAAVGAISSRHGNADQHAHDISIAADCPAAQSAATLDRAGDGDRIDEPGRADDAGIRPRAADERAANGERVDACAREDRAALRSRVAHDVSDDDQLVNARLAADRAAFKIATALEIAVDRQGLDEAACRDDACERLRAADDVARLRGNDVAFREDRAAPNPHAALDQAEHGDVVDISTASDRAAGAAVASEQLISQNDGVYAGEAGNRAGFMAGAAFDFARDARKTEHVRGENARAAESAPALQFPIDRDVPNRPLRHDVCRLPAGAADEIARDVRGPDRAFCVNGAAAQTDAAHEVAADVDIADLSVEIEHAAAHENVHIPQRARGFERAEFSDKIALQIPARRLRVEAAPAHRAHIQKRATAIVGNRIANLNAAKIADHSHRAEIESLRIDESRVGKSIAVPLDHADHDIRMREDRVRREVELLQFAADDMRRSHEFPVRAFAHEESDHVAVGLRENDRRRRDPAFEGFDRGEETAAGSFHQSEEIVSVKERVLQSAISPKAGRERAYLRHSAGVHVV